MSETTNQTIYSGYQLHYSILSWIHRVCQTSPGFLIGRSCVNHQQNCCSTYDTTWWKLNRSWNHSLLILLLKWFKCPFCWFHPNSCFGSGHVTRPPTGHVKTHHVVPPDRSLWHGRNQSPAPRWFTKHGHWKSPNQMGGGTSSTPGLMTGGTGRDPQVMFVGHLLGYNPI